MQHLFFKIVAVSRADNVARNWRYFLGRSVRFSFQSLIGPSNSPRTNLVTVQQLLNDIQKTVSAHKYGRAQNRISFRPWEVTGGLAKLMVGLVDQTPDLKLIAPSADYDIRISAEGPVPPGEIDPICTDLERVLYDQLPLIISNWAVHGSGRRTPFGVTHLNFDPHFVSVVMSQIKISRCVVSASGTGFVLVSFPRIIQVAVPGQPVCQLEFPRKLDVSIVIANGSRYGTTGLNSLSVQMDSKSTPLIENPYSDAEWRFMYDRNDLLVADPSDIWQLFFRLGHELNKCESVISDDLVFQGLISLETGGYFGQSPLECFTNKLDRFIESHYPNRPSDELVYLYRLRQILISGTSIAAFKEKCRAFEALITQRIASTMHKSQRYGISHEPTLKLSVRDPFGSGRFIPEGILSPGSILGIYSRFGGPTHRSLGDLMNGYIRWLKFSELNRNCAAQSEFLAVSRYTPIDPKAPTSVTLPAFINEVIRCAFNRASDLHPLLVESVWAKVHAFCGDIQIENPIENWLAVTHFLSQIDEWVFAATQDDVSAVEVAKTYLEVVGNKGDSRTLISWIQAHSDSMSVREWTEIEMLIPPTDPETTTILRTLIRDRLIQMRRTSARDQLDEPTIEALRRLSDRDFGICCMLNIFAPQLAAESSQGVGLKKGSKPVPRKKSAQEVRLSAAGVPRPMAQSQQIAAILALYPGHRVKLKIDGLTGEDFSEISILDFVAEDGTFWGHILETIQAFPELLGSILVRHFDQRPIAVAVQISQAMSENLSGWVPIFARLLSPQSATALTDSDRNVIELFGSAVKASAGRGASSKKLTPILIEFLSRIPTSEMLSLIEQFQDHFEPGFSKVLIDYGQDRLLECGNWPYIIKASIRLGFSAEDVFMRAQLKLKFDKARATQNEIESTIAFLKAMVDSDLFPRRTPLGLDVIHPLSQLIAVRLKGLPELLDFLLWFEFPVDRLELPALLALVESEPFLRIQSTELGAELAVGILKSCGRVLIGDTRVPVDRRLTVLNWLFERDFKKVFDVEPTIFKALFKQLVEEKNHALGNALAGQLFANVAVTDFDLRVQVASIFVSCFSVLSDELRELYLPVVGPVISLKDLVKILKELGTHPSFRESAPRAELGWGIAKKNLRSLGEIWIRNAIGLLPKSSFDGALSDVTLRLMASRLGEVASSHHMNVFVFLEFCRGVVDGYIKEFANFEDKKTILLALVKGVLRSVPAACSLIALTLKDQLISKSEAFQAMIVLFDSLHRDTDLPADIDYHAVAAQLVTKIADFNLTDPSPECPPDSLVGIRGRAFNEEDLAVALEHLFRPNMWRLLNAIVSLADFSSMFDAQFNRRTIGRFYFELTYRLFVNSDMLTPEQAGILQVGHRVFPKVIQWLNEYQESPFTTPTRMCQLICKIVGLYHLDRTTPISDAHWIERVESLTLAARFQQRFREISEQDGEEGAVETELLTDLADSISMTLTYYLANNPKQLIPRENGDLMLGWMLGRITDNWDSEHLIDTFMRNFGLLRSFSTPVEKLVVAISNSNHIVSYVTTPNVRNLMYHVFVEFLPRHRDKLELLLDLAFLFYVGNERLKLFGITGDSDALGNLLLNVFAFGNTEIMPDCSALQLVLRAETTPDRWNDSQFQGEVIRHLIEKYHLDAVECPARQFWLRLDTSAKLKLLIDGQVADALRAGQIAAVTGNVRQILNSPDFPALLFNDLASSMAKIAGFDGRYNRVLPPTIRRSDVVGNFSQPSIPMLGVSGLFDDLANTLNDAMLEPDHPRKLLVRTICGRCRDTAMGQSVSLINWFVYEFGRLLRTPQFNLFNSAPADRVYLLSDLLMLDDRFGNPADFGPSIIRLIETIEANPGPHTEVALNNIQITLHFYLVEFSFITPLMNSVDRAQLESLEYVIFDLALLILSRMAAISPGRVETFVNRMIDLARLVSSWSTVERAFNRFGQTSHWVANAETRKSLIMFIDMILAHLTPDNHERAVTMVSRLRRQLAQPAA